MRSVDKEKKLMKKARPGKTLSTIVCGGSCGPASAEGIKELSQESLTVFKERFSSLLLQDGGHSFQNGGCIHILNSVMQPDWLISLEPLQEDIV